MQFPLPLYAIELLSPINNSGVATHVGILDILDIRQANKLQADIASANDRDARREGQPLLQQQKRSSRATKAENKYIPTSTKRRRDKRSAPSSQHSEPTTRSLQEPSAKPEATTRLSRWIKLPRKDGLLARWMAAISIHRQRRKFSWRRQRSGDFTRTVEPVGLSSIREE